MPDQPKHATHPEIINRLKRADGHLRRVIAMLDGGSACLDIAQQLHAVEKAIVQAKRTLIHDHIDHCLDDHQTAKVDVDKFKAIAKYL